jgi:hypothetical protein
LDKKFLQPLLEEFFKIFERTKEEFYALPGMHTPPPCSRRFYLDDVPHRMDPFEKETRSGVVLSNPVFSK